jgi:hypothetical protein
VEPQSAWHELQRIRETTEKCLAQAEIAYRRAIKNAQYYKTKAREVRALAAGARFPEIRAKWLRIAAVYEDLVNLSECRRRALIPRSDVVPREVTSETGELAPADRLVRASSHRAEAEDQTLHRMVLVAKLAQEIGHDLPAFTGEAASFVAEPTEELMTGRPVEDPVAQAHRHVAEAEGHIARQEALIAKLSQDRRHAALAAEAKEILDTLKHTLSLARAHLANELKE